MRKNKNGFTVVELLIVIVVIAILATIGIVAYSGIQVRTRDTKRADDITTIQKALEAYRAIHGIYPASQGPGSNVPPDFSSAFGTTAYSYSNATDDSWLRALNTSGLVGGLPKDPVNDGTHYYIYLAYGTGGTGACDGPFYVLMAEGWEGGSATMPANAKTLTCSDGVTFAGWSQSDVRAIFSNITTPTP